MSQSGVVTREHILSLDHAPEAIVLAVVVVLQIRVPTDPLRLAELEDLEPACRDSNGKCGMGASFGCPA